MCGHALAGAINIGNGFSIGAIYAFQGQGRITIRILTAGKRLSIIVIVIIIAAFTAAANIAAAIDAAPFTAAQVIFICTIIANAVRISISISVTFHSACSSRIDCSRHWRRLLPLASHCTAWRRICTRNTQILNIPCVERI